MRLFTSIICLMVALHCSYAPPVNPDKSNEESDVKDNLDDYMEYSRYLKEVVQALESDPDFRERLEKADVDDVRSGKIADQLDFVNHNVRTKLDEIKRRELERLRHLATKQYELTNNLDAHMGKVPSNEHLDHANPHTFEIEDLKRLIKKTTADLEEADKQRKEEFKEYEMQKEFDKHQELENMNETQKREYEDKLKKEEDAKKHHEPLHHPGSKQQLEEVWEKQDHMDQQFDPKVFFMMHDVDGNGAWDADEVKALFIKELDKLYGPGGPNKDLHERAEEMERMREHVFKENDKNRDGLIDFHEFMMETQKSEFNQDEAEVTKSWKPIDENQIYTQAEYQEYERRRLEELRYLQQRGLVDAHGRPLPGAQHQIHQAQQAFHQAYQQQYHQQGYQQHAQGQQYYPHGQPPQGYPPAHGQMPPQGYQQPPGQVPQYQPPQGVPQGQQQYQPQGQQQQYQPQGQQQQYQPPQGQPPQGQPQQYQPPQSQPSQGQPQQYQPPQGQPPQGQQQQYQPQGQQQQYQPPQGQPPQSQQQYQPPQGQQQYQQPQNPQGQPVQNLNQQNLNQAPAQGQQQGQGQPAAQDQTKGQPQPSQGQAPPSQSQPEVKQQNQG